MPKPVTTEADYPILRIYGRSTLTAETIAVTDIDTDFEQYPEFTERVVDGLLKDGSYDDSDDDGYRCVFSTDRPDDVRRQWLALKREYADLFDEDDPDLAAPTEPAAE